MKEEFLHYIWQFKKFDFNNCKTTCGKKIAIVASGEYLQQAGPDFFNARIYIESQLWAGNVEIHLQSSDWYIHNHQNDNAYENIILHVVWQHDTEVFRKDNQKIPVLELKNYVDKNIVTQYNKLFAPKKWILCENDISNVDSFLIESFKEKLFIDRLQKKATPIQDFLKKTENDWEAALFCFVAKSFGLNSNATVFFDIASAISYSIFRKEKDKLLHLEALLFGISGMLNQDFEDQYPLLLKQTWHYLKHKYAIDTIFISPLAFFKQRPDNFPTIRLAQFASFYHYLPAFFEWIDKPHKINKEALNKIATSEYWHTHYLFDKPSKYKKKNLSKSFVELLFINTLIPFSFIYNKSLGKEDIEETISFVTTLQPEKNVITEKFSNLQLKSKSALDTQSFIELKKNYCDFKRCLHCAIGASIINS